MKIRITASVPSARAGDRLYIDEFSADVIEWHVDGDTGALVINGIDGPDGDGFTIAVFQKDSWHRVVFPEDMP